MKTKDLLKIWTIVVAAFLAAACSSADDATNDNGNHTDNSIRTRTVTFTATIGADTRTGMVNDGDGYVSFYWHKGDAIGIQTKDERGHYSVAKFTTDCETGSTTATFTGEVEWGWELQTYAVYPCPNVGLTFSENSVKITTKSEYEYMNVDEGAPDTIIFPETDDETTTYPTHSTSMPMLGTISGDNITFKHLGGLAVIRIDNMPYADGQLSIEADEHLNGEYTVSDLSANEAQITTSNESGGLASVQFYIRDAKVGSPAVFFLPLATGTYNNLELTFAYGGPKGIKYKIPYGSLTIGRGEIHAISLTTNSKGVLRNVRSLGNNVYLVNNRRFIDLGLESGLLWAEVNVGSTSPYFPGDYYAWGETEPKESYTNDNATWGSTAYSQTTLLAEHDAATENWGAGIRIPTQEDFNELFKSSNVSREWSYKYIEQATSPKNRYYVRFYNKSNSDNQYIILPASGVMNGSSLSAGPSAYYPEADYWTSTTDNSTINDKRAAIYMNCMQSGNYGSKYEITSTPIYYGYNIRAVADR